MNSPIKGFPTTYLDAKVRILTGMDKITRVHDLKLNSDLYEPLATNLKQFEIRFNDRDYQVGDTLLLRSGRSVGSPVDTIREWQYDRRWVLAHVTFLLDPSKYGMLTAPGHVAMGIKVITVGRSDEWKRFKGITDNLLTSHVS